jgi:DNA-binding response OmpR family regulator
VENGERYKKEKILLIDRDATFGLTVSDRLKDLGFQAQATVCPEDGIQFLTKIPPDLLMLNAEDEGNGRIFYEKILRLCKESQIPIIFLINGKSEELPLQALRIGQDMIVKPLVFGELLLRIKMIFHRMEMSYFPTNEGNRILQEEDFDFFSARVSPKCLSIQFPNGRVESIGRKMLGLLFLFASHRGEILSRRRVVRSVWGPHGNPRSRSMEQYIVRIREIFRRNGINGGAVLRTIHGVGYLYTGSADDGTSKV